MKKHFLLIFSIGILTLFSCSKKTKYEQPNVNFKNIEADYMKWWTYENKNIIFSSNFIPIDNFSNKISKNDFLKNLTSGNYIPLKLLSNDNKTYYKLFKLDNNSDKNIRITIKSISIHAYKNFKMEGEKFPMFNFKDLNGIEYNSENTKGKIIILKCWFINCTACVAEIPELNELVKKYQNRNDIIFISLTLDSKEDLEHFITKKAFKYAIVPDQENFIYNSLNISQFPTHFIINKNGIIEKVVDNSYELILALKNIN